VGSCREAVGRRQALRRREHGGSKGEGGGGVEGGEGSAVEGGEGSAVEGGEGSAVEGGAVSAVEGGAVERGSGGWAAGSSNGPVASRWAEAGGGWRGPGDHRLVLPPLVLRPLTAFVKLL
jgi:hypothetical protein